MSLNAIADAGTDTARQKQTNESRLALVADLTTRMKDARTFWEPQFERIREDIAFAGGDQWSDAEDKMAGSQSDKYQVNFVQRELNQQVSGIYAKNPDITCERRHRLEYAVWDGTQASLMQAQMILQQFGPQVQQAAQARMMVQTHDDQQAALAQQGQQPQPEPPEITQARQVASSLPAPVLQAMQVVNDFQQGLKRKQLYDKIGATAELVLNHQLDEQQPDFESQMKDLVLREKTTGAGFVTIKFQRENEIAQTTSTATADIIERIAHIKGLLAGQESNEQTDSQKGELELELQTLQTAMQEQQEISRKEGVVFDFKPSTSILVDPKCRSLFQFLGADWIAEQLMLTPARVQEIWGVDVTTKAVSYQHGQEAANTTNLNTKAGGNQPKDNAIAGNWPDKAQVCVWIIQDKVAQMKYVICDGYDDFLEEPEAPWPAVRGFWQTVALKLNRIEIEENNPKAGLTIYGQSTVRLLKPMQQEMNRTQEALREHRIANRPSYFCGKDTFDNNDRKAIANRSPHDVIPLNNVGPGADVSKLLAMIPTAPIDQRLYETSGIMQQSLLVTGTQQANLGAQAANEKATGQAIAEQSRIVGVSSETDSLDTFLCELARISGEMLFLEMQQDTVQEIAGPGAVWPQDPPTRADINDALYLKIKAGSMGRPNRAMEIANIQQMMPQLIQLAQLRGLPLDPLVKYVAKILEFGFDVEEWLSSAPAPQPGQGGPQGHGGGASESISIKLSDLTPDERSQALALAGIQATPGASSQPPPTPSPTNTPSPASVQPVAPGGGMVQTMLKKTQNTIA